jgi:hypothetical protein
MSQFGPAFSVEALGCSGASPYQPGELELIPIGCSLLITLWRNFHPDPLLGQGSQTQAYQGVSFASTINGTGRAKTSNHDCGKRYGCLGKRSMVFAGCDVVA